MRETTLNQKLKIMEGKDIIWFKVYEQLKLTKRTFRILIKRCAKKISDSEKSIHSLILTTEKYSLNSNQQKMKLES